ncbi:CLUMA_CG012929, isoform A [Clunio marinus]|uniref:CLUMA_CG012929, isoform A n=1 Tax=Clunio marinus TaxID=568069 RepID=A0A1J1IMC3_9DIPT|nr:CLUMA_CG012929, isoform A [Clunio marinus]
MRFELQKAEEQNRPRVSSFAFWEHHGFSMFSKLKLSNYKRSANNHKRHTFYAEFNKSTSRRLFFAFFIAEAFHVVTGYNKKRAEKGKKNELRWKKLSEILEVFLFCSCEKLREAYSY